MKKPREFWIDMYGEVRSGDDWDTRMIAYYLDDYEKDYGAVRVIEKSAYNELLKQNEELKEKIKRLELENSNLEYEIMDMIHD